MGVLCTWQIKNLNLKQKLSLTIKPHSGSPTLPDFLHGHFKPTNPRQEILTASRCYHSELQRYRARKEKAYNTALQDSMFKYWCQSSKIYSFGLSGSKNPARPTWMWKLHLFIVCSCLLSMQHRDKQTCFTGCLLPPLRLFMSPLCAAFASPWLLYALLLLAQYSL